MVFDKTGTITRGFPMVTTVVQFVDSAIFYLPKVMAIIGTAESNSEHPIASAITRFVKDALNTDLNAKYTDFQVSGTANISIRRKFKYFLLDFLYRMFLVVVCAVKYQI